MAKPLPIRVCPECDAIAKHIGSGAYRCSRDTCAKVGVRRDFPTLRSQTTNPRRANKGMAAGSYHIRAHTGD